MSLVWGTYLKSCVGHCLYSFSCLNVFIFFFSEFISGPSQPMWQVLRGRIELLGDLLEKDGLTTYVAWRCFVLFCTELLKHVLFLLGPVVYSLSFTTAGQGTAVTIGVSHTTTCTSSLSLSLQSALSALQMCWARIGINLFVYIYNSTVCHGSVCFLGQSFFIISKQTKMYPLEWWTTIIKDWSYKIRK